MYEISKENKDKIATFLRAVVVPATVGASLVSIADLLDGLKEIEDKTEVKEENKE